MHTPVLLKEVIEILALAPGQFVIDGTLDGGGHARAMLKEISPGGKFLGVDWDKEMIARQTVSLKSAAVKIFLAQGNYADLPEILETRDLPKADAILLDLGFSSEQLTSGRGFSFQSDDLLALTYDRERLPAKSILRQLTEYELANIIQKYGGERYARRIAKAIKMAGKKQPIKRANELASIIAQAVPKNYERGRINPATRTFQALRIYANDELGNLKRCLVHLSRILRPGGRAAIISFHSLEDGMVKNHFRELHAEGLAKILTKKPIEAAAEEIAKNPRSRSAKLRAIQLA